MSLSRAVATIESMLASSKGHRGVRQLGLRQQQTDEHRLSKAHCGGCGTARRCICPSNIRGGTQLLAQPRINKSTFNQCCIKNCDPFVPTGCLQAEAFDVIGFSCSMTVSSPPKVRERRTKRLLMLGVATPPSQSSSRSTRPPPRDIQVQFVRCLARTNQRWLRRHLEVLVSTRREIENDARATIRGGEIRLPSFKHTRKIWLHLIKVMRT